MNDISYCNGEGCELRKTCKRFLSHANHVPTGGLPLWYIDPAYNEHSDECEMFMDENA